MGKSKHRRHDQSVSPFSHKAGGRYLSILYLSQVLVSALVLGVFSGVPSGLFGDTTPDILVYSRTGYAYNPFHSHREMQEQVNTQANSNLHKSESLIGTGGIGWMLSVENTSPARLRWSVRQAGFGRTFFEFADLTHVDVSAALQMQYRFSDRIMMENIISMHKESAILQSRVTEEPTDLYHYRKAAGTISLSVRPRVEQVVEMKAGYVRYAFPENNPLQLDYREVELQLRASQEFLYRGLDNTVTLNLGWRDLPFFRRPAADFDGQRQGTNPHQHWRYWTGTIEHSIIPVSYLHFRHYGTVAIRQDLFKGFHNYRERERGLRIILMTNRWQIRLSFAHLLRKYMTLKTASESEIERFLTYKWVTAESQIAYQFQPHMQLFATCEIQQSANNLTVLSRVKGTRRSYAQFQLGINVLLNSLQSQKVPVSF